MAKSRSWSVLALLLPVVLLVAACAGGSGSAPVSKDLVYISQSEPARGLNPALASGNVIDQQFMQLVFGQLLYQDSSGAIQPGLAESVTPNQDLSHWTVKLRQGLTFSDGSPFTVDAIQSYWTKVADPATGSPVRASAAEISAMTAPDPTTLQVTLKAPDGTWNQALNSSFGSIPSPTAYQAAGDTFGTTPQNTVGAGPFVLTELQKGARYVYKKNPKYYEPNKPNLESVEVRIISDSASRANTIKTGGADVTNFLTANSDLVSLQNSGLQSATAVGGGVAALVLRTDQGPTADVRLREALQRAVDIDAVISRAAQGATKASALMDPKGPWGNDVVYPSYDPQKAQQLVDDYLASTGQQSVALTLIGANNNQKVWESFKQEWDKIRGLNVTLQIETNVATSTRIAKRDYPNMLNSALPDTPRRARDLLYSSSSQNTTYTKDPQLDQLILAANNTADVAEQKVRMQAVMERINALVPGVVQYRLPLHWFWQMDVHGVELSLTTGVIRFENVTKGGGRPSS